MNPGFHPNALTIANEQGFQSIPFPLIGAGSGSFNPERSKAFMLDEFDRLDYPLEVKVVVFRL